MAEKSKNHQRGFTILEMLVSIFIIVMISGIFLANYRYYGKSSELDMTAQKLAGDLRKMLSYSMGLKEFEGSIPPEFPTGGWGVFFDMTPSENKKFYAFFADADGDSTCDSNCSDSSSDEDYPPRIILPDGLIIDSLYLDGSSANEVNLTFTPPDPIVSICGQNSSQCEHDELEIMLRSSKNNKTKTVLINKFGLIDVEN